MTRTAPEASSPTPMQVPDSAPTFCIVLGLALVLAAQLAPDAWLRSGEWSDEQALEHPNLRRGQPDARRIIHGRQHIVGQRAQLGRDLVDLVCTFLETRVRMDKDRQN